MQNVKQKANQFFWPQFPVGFYALFVKNSSLQNKKEKELGQSCFSVNSTEPSFFFWGGGRQLGLFKGLGRKDTPTGEDSRFVEKAMSNFSLGWSVRNGKASVQKVRTFSSDRSWGFQLGSHKVVFLPQVACTRRTHVTRCTTRGGTACCRGRRSDQRGTCRTCNSRFAASGTEWKGSCMRSTTISQLFLRSRLWCDTQGAVHHSLVRLSKCAP